MSASLRDALGVAFDTDGVEADQRAIMDQLSATAAPVVRPGAALEPIDYTLTLHWAGLADRGRTHCGLVAGLSDVRACLGDYDAARIISARSAELVVMQWYREVGQTVEDVSIAQLQLRAKGWRSHDMAVDGRPIDVKNARRSARRNQGYSEHIAKFKAHRPFSAQVYLVGVLSDFLSCDDFARGRRGEVCVLGEVSQSDLAGLAGYLLRRFSDVFDTKSLTVMCIAKPGLVPGWMFEYPAEHYVTRGIAIARVGDLVEDAARRRWRLPKYLISFVDNAERASGYSESDRDCAIWMELRNLAREIGFSRRGLYYCLLGTALQAAMKGDRHFHPSLFRAWMFDCNEVTRPLGLCDPLGYVDALIAALEGIWGAGAETRLGSYRMFRLTAPGILRGVRQSGEEETVLAYCGGWKSDTAKPCGRNPLHLGIARVCPKCGRLVCPDCGWCSLGCKSTG